MLVEQVWVLLPEPTASTRGQLCVPLFEHGHTDWVAWAGGKQKQLRTEKMNGAVSDLGPNPDSRIYELSCCPAVRPAVWSLSVYLFPSVWMTVKNISEYSLLNLTSDQASMNLHIPHSLCLVSSYPLGI